jgi:hypothetical protein
VSEAQESYEDLIGVAGAALAPDEFWCVESPTEGVLYDTMSKRFDYPVILFCEALKCEWDDATDQGFKLIRARKSAAPTSDEAGV